MKLQQIPRSYVDDIKNRVHIIDVAEQLGHLPERKEGNRFQGSCCPGGHESKNGRPFVIYPSVQGFKCFNCGLKGDVIDLVEVAQGLDFMGALDYLADLAGMPRFTHQEMTDEERAKWQEKQENRRRVFEALTEAAEYYHQQLLKDEEMLVYVMQHYGLTDDTISTYRIGYSTGDGLYKHLSAKGFSDTTIGATGLYYAAGILREFFNHRIFFPYWRNGQVVYAIGRRTERTPDNQYEKAKYKT